MEITVIFYSFALSQLLQRTIRYYFFNLDLTNLPLLFLFSFGMDLHCSWVVLVHGVLMIFQLSRRLPGDLFVLVLYTFLWSGSWSSNLLHSVLTFWWAAISIYLYMHGPTIPEGVKNGVWFMVGGYLVTVVHLS